MCSDDSVSSLDENSQEYYEKQLMLVIDNLHIEEKVTILYSIETS